RFVSLAPVGHWRQVRRIRLHQQPLERHPRRDVTHRRRVLERDDAGDGDVEAEIERGARGVPVLGEAVHDAAGLAGPLLAHDPQRVLACRAGVDDQWLAAFPRGPDVRAESLPLPGEVAARTEIVETGLADADDALGA